MIFKRTCYKYDLNVIDLKDIEWSKDVAARLLNGEIGFLMRGKSEVGPRALGNRSIIAYPKFLDIADKVNNIKLRSVGDHWLRQFWQHLSRNSIMGA